MASGSDGFQPNPASWPTKHSNAAIGSESRDAHRARVSGISAHAGSMASANTSRHSAGVDLADAHGLLEDGGSHTKVQCIQCRRRSKKSLAEYYCQDCRVALCTSCKLEHVDDVKMNRHSISTISKTFAGSPNQGPFPNLTEIGSIKFDSERVIRGSTFLLNGELVITDFTNSKIVAYGADYTRKKITSMFVPKEHTWDNTRPKPLDITDITSNTIAFTANNGCVYIAKIGQSMIMEVHRIITVISFESNHGECLGIAYNTMEEGIHVGCSSDREGIYICIYSIDGQLRRKIDCDIDDTPEYLSFGIDVFKLYTADSDSVTVYDVTDFGILDRYTELEGQTKDILLDKYGYLYTLALERRTFKTPGSIYRLNPETGVTRVTELPDKPSSMCYNAKTNVLAVTFSKSNRILLFRLELRTYQKQIHTDLKQYPKFVSSKKRVK